MSSAFCRILLISLSAHAAQHSNQQRSSPAPALSIMYPIGGEKIENLIPPPPVLNGTYIFPKSLRTHSVKSQTKQDARSSFPPLSLPLAAKIYDHPFSLSRLWNLSPGLNTFYRTIQLQAQIGIFSSLKSNQLFLTSQITHNYAKKDSQFI